MGHAKSERVDDSELVAMMAELRRLASLLPSEVLSEFSERLDVLDEKPIDLILVEVNGESALGAGEVGVFIKPSALFVELVAALRARALAVQLVW